MARFTEAQKSSLKKVVMDKTFGGRREALTAMRQDLALRAYQSQGADRVKLLAELPRGVVQKSESLRCYFGGQSVCLTLPEALPQGYQAYEHRLRFGTDDVLTKRFEEINLVNHKLDADKELLDRQLRALLNEVNTDKQLLALWPEAVEFLPKGEIKNLPAPLTDDLNKLLVDLSK